MFSKLFGKKETDNKPKAPEIMGLYLGGSFELDPLKLRLIEPELVIEKAASQHIIQAVGEVNLDTGGKILRFYTDDDAYLQVILDGGDTENHITDVKLWYFYETKTIGSEAQWKQTLNSGVSTPTYSLEGNSYQRVWDAVGEESPPVAMTEKTYEEDGDVSETDQFVMLYERHINQDDTETVLVSAEEKLINNNFDRCLVVSTGFNIGQADITING
ncbi:YjfK family protein [Paraglaciecola aquimarina]|uniref:YjfK family protein n=1 Tax=Paraglaciecola algarum TaxID=3050085 RepID=A0ABS9D9Q4_9ALTE|nr:YjfK family protein [Paraglaciecola sp. G1-23]MCF2949685.1 YjfK family protein [Paraglaciecola sp. G1-23]